MPPKRLREGGDGDGGSRGGGGREGGSAPPATTLLPAASPVPALKRRCRSFDLEIRGCRHLQELTNRVKAMEATLSKIPEELRKVLTSLFNRGPGSRIEQNLPPVYKLLFLNSMSRTIFTKREVQGVDQSQIKIRMVCSNQQGSNCPDILSANVKIVVLDGDFNADNRENWTPEEFDNHIVRPRDKVGAVLTGKLDVILQNSEAYLHGVFFADNSSFTRSGKFRLGVKLIGDVGVRVQEGITKPFTVKDRRGEGYIKRDIPKLDDEVCCMHKVAKGGVFHKALKQAGIPLVKDFLWQYYKDAKALRNILSKASQPAWKTIVDHAVKCDPGRGLCSYLMDDKKVRLYFSSLGQIVGATIAGKYSAFSDLDMSSKAQVEEWSKVAYECMTTNQEPDYEMYDSKPRPINSSTLQGLITIGPKSSEPTDQIIPKADEQDTSKGGSFYGRIGSIRVRTSPSAQENNETDASFNIDVEMNSGLEIQNNETPNANYNAGSVTLHCPTSAVDKIIASVALDQAALTMIPDSYQMSFANEGPPSLGHWRTEQYVDSQYASPFSPFSQADLCGLSTQNSFNMDQLFEELGGAELPPDVGCGLELEELPSCSKWVKLIAIVKWMAILRACKSIADA